MNSLDRRPAVAGLFYPEGPSELKNLIQELLDRSTPPSVDEPLAFIVPHAGYIYSGPVAALAYRSLRGFEFDTIIILGPNHHGRGFWGHSVYARGRFQTPLGYVEVDVPLAQDILSRLRGAKFDPESHEGEHSIEAQIPFLQVVQSRFRIVPIVTADEDRKSCEDLGNALASVIQDHGSKKILILASTDLSHYFPYQRACEMDERAIHAIETLDPDCFYRTVEVERKAELCGFTSVLAALFALKKLGAKKSKTLAYANSGDTAGDRSRVVGYLSMAITK